MSFLTAVLDNLVFVAAFGSTGSIAQSQIAARLCAMTFNYLGARRMVFHSQQRHAVVLPKYVLLVAANGLVSYAFIRWLHDGMGWHAVPAKLVAEGLLFVANFVLQRDIVFTRKRSVREGHGLERLLRECGADGEVDAALHDGGFTGCDPESCVGGEWRWAVGDRRDRRCE